MSVNRLLEKLRAGKVVLGLGNTYPAPGIIECMCKGWDFVWIDTQHGTMDYLNAVHACRAAEGRGLDTLLRVPGHEPGALGKFADLGPSAIMVPMVNSAEQAQGLVSALRFPPLGERSYGGRRVVDLYGRDYYAKQEMLLVVQIETVEACRQAPDIIATEGVDCLFFSPDDMRLRMDLPMNTPIVENEELRDAMAGVARAATEAGKFCGCVATDKETLTVAIEQGYRLIAGGGDAGFLRTMAAQRLVELRNVIERRAENG